MSYRKYVQKGGALSDEDNEQLVALLNKYPNLDRDTAELVVGTKYLKDKQAGSKFLSSYNLDYRNYRKKLDDGLRKASLDNLADNVDMILGTYNQSGNKSYGKLTETYSDTLFPFDKKQKIRYDTEYEDKEIEEPDGEDEKTYNNIRFNPEKDVYVGNMKRGLFNSKKRNAIKISPVNSDLNKLSQKSSFYDTINPNTDFVDYMLNISDEEKQEKGFDKLKVKRGKRYMGGTTYGNKEDYVEIPKNISDEELSDLKKRVAEETQNFYTTKVKTPRYKKVKVKVPVSKQTSYEEYEPAFQAGGMIEGAPHEGGGVPIEMGMGEQDVEVEGGEIVLSVQASDALNQAVMAYQQSGEEDKEMIAKELGKMILQERMMQMEAEMEGEGANEETAEQENTQMAMRGMGLKKRLEKLNEF